MPLLGPKIGFGPRWLQPWTSKLKKCDELKVDSCPDGPTDGCCAVVSCTYCLELQVSNGETYYGTADWDGEQWHGAVDGIEFVARWVKVYDVCGFEVEFGGVLVSRLECYEVGCRDSSGEAAVDVDGYDAVLIWTVKEDQPLPYVSESGNSGSSGCMTWFCGECECTCKTLCATVTTPLPGCLNCTGPLPLADPYATCSGPAWAGNLSCGDDSYYLSVSLIRDEYSGDCLVQADIGGEMLEAVPITDCGRIRASWVLYDGTIITVDCMECSCDEIEGCQTGCCWPLVYPAAYPCGYFTDLTTTIDAPGCDIDGMTAILPNTGAVLRKGTCGPCGESNAESLGTTIGQQPSGMTDPSTGYCMYTPCGVGICVKLECVQSSSIPYGLDDCCGKFRLWVGTTIRLAGDVGDRPDDIEGSGCFYWKQISPSSCVCLPGGAGVMLLFEVSLEPYPCETVWPSGVCAGVPTCCEPVCSGFTLTI